MHIGFFFSNKNFDVSDFRLPEKGNPGLGGTWYCFLLLMRYLACQKIDWKFSVYSLCYANFPSGVCSKKVRGFEQALSEATHDGVDLLVMKHETDASYFDLIEKFKLKIVFWTHNYLFHDTATLIAKSTKIVANVFVGKQQYDRYIDHPIISKSVFIFNMLPSFERRERKIQKRKHVVYMGALVEGKGFLELAKLWKYILKKVPDAHLDVLGSGKLYESDTSMGRLGIASESYEKKFLPYVTNEKGILLDSVTFHGRVGQDKFEIFEAGTVGVVNPSARTEIFSMSILEMGSAGLPVVSLAKNGIPDSILNLKSGILAHNQKEIADGIVTILKNERLASELSIGAREFSLRFTPEKILPIWISFFERIVEKDTSLFEYKGVSAPYLNNAKWLRVLIRIFRRLGIAIPPFIWMETMVFRSLLCLKKILSTRFKGKR